MENWGFIVNTYTFITEAWVVYTLQMRLILEQVTVVCVNKIKDQMLTVHI